MDLPDGNEPEVHRLTLPGRYEGEGPLAVLLVGYVCQRGAYNGSTVYLSLLDEEITIHSFAAPKLRVEEGGSDDAPVLKDMALEGFTATLAATGATFDPKTMLLETFAKHRGLGDAYSRATYRFTSEGFVLLDWDEDPTLNGKLDPVTVIENGRIVLPAPFTADAIKAVER